MSLRLDVTSISAQAAARADRDAEDSDEARRQAAGDESGDAAVVRRAMNAFKRGSDSAVARALAEAARKHAESEGRGVVASPMAGKDPITGKLCLAPCVDGRIVTRNPVENIGA